MKTIAKNIIVSILGWQLRRLNSKNNFKVIAVAGSIGKTSTKLAIANVLKGGLRVQHQVGNYNDIVTVPLIFFGQNTPSLFNPFAWIGVFWKNEKIINKTYAYDAVVVELGTDGPGQLVRFNKYLHVDIGVLTSIVPEHMQFFDDIQAVADEELEISKFSKELLINKDLTLAKYLKILDVPPIYYGIHQDSDYKLTKPVFSGEYCNFEVQYQQRTLLSSKHELVSEPQLYSVLAAVAVADKLGLSTAQIKEGLAKVRPVSGRMQRLKGTNDSIIIDDTYNASPDATKAALDTLYRVKAVYKVAVLGNMNELGKYSEEAHTQIGEYCDPKKVDLVVTIGPDANKFLAEAAEKNGCKVQSFDSPYTAGEYLRTIINKGTVILVKGSQNKVFAEETVKQILADKKDQSKLVRQSDDWLKIKQKAFSV